MAEGYDRFRSFAERYLVARAEQFDKGSELEQGWRAIQDAKKLYAMTAHASVGAEPDMGMITGARDAANMGGAATQAPPPMPGVTGPPWKQPAKHFTPPLLAKGPSNGTPQTQPVGTAKALRRRFLGY